jgi:hypothetical protein
MGWPVTLDSFKSIVRALGEGRTQASLALRPHLPGSPEYEELVQWQDHIHAKYLASRSRLRRAVKRYTALQACAYHDGGNMGRRAQARRQIKATLACLMASPLAGAIA